MLSEHGFGTHVRLTRIMMWVGVAIGLLCFAMGAISDLEHGLVSGIGLGLFFLGFSLLGRATLLLMQTREVVVHTDGLRYKPLPAERRTACGNHVRPSVRRLGNVPYTRARSQEEVLRLSPTAHTMGSA